MLALVNKTPRAPRAHVRAALAAPPALPLLQHHVDPARLQAAYGARVLDDFLRLAAADGAAAGPGAGPGAGAVIGVARLVGKLLGEPVAAEAEGLDPAAHGGCGSG